MSDEALRALEKKWRTLAVIDNDGTRLICASELSAILSARQEVAPVAWQTQLADSLSCFWNAAIGAEVTSHDSTARATASAIAQGFAAVETRLREFAQSSPAQTSEARDCPAPTTSHFQEHEMSDEYAILRAAHAAGARIQVWRLNEDADHAFDGHWENIDGRPRFLQPLHLYRIDPDSIAAPSSEASEAITVTNEMVLKAAEAFVMHRGCVDQTVSHGPIRAALEAAFLPTTAHTLEAIDAARYRWIRKNSAVRFFDKDIPSDYGSLKNDVELDDAIDAAMRQEAE